MSLSAETQAEIRSLRRKAVRYRKNAAELRLAHAAHRDDPYSVAPLYGLTAAADLAEADRLEHIARMLERGLWK